MLSYMLDSEAHGIQEAGTWCVWWTIGPVWLSTGERATVDLLVARVRGR